MADRPPLPREEVQRILVRLSPLSAEGKIVLIGGQAVAWWTVFLELEDSSREIEIYASEDIDFEGAARSAQIAAELIGGEVRLPDLDHHTRTRASSCSPIPKDSGERSTSWALRWDLMRPTCAHRRS